MRVNTNTSYNLAQLRELQKPEYPQMQGLVATAFSFLPYSAYVLLRINDLDDEKTSWAAHNWLAELVTQVTQVKEKDEAITSKQTREPAINVAFTYQGLRAFGLNEYELSTFSFAFQDGMTSPHRSRMLGDSLESVPMHWHWGQPDSEAEIHLLLMYFAETQGEVDYWVKAQKLLWAKANLLCVKTLPGTYKEREHFGFVDNIGQPVVNGTPNRQNPDQPLNTKTNPSNQKERTEHETIINAGEFVMGYVNADNALALGPYVERRRDPANTLPAVHRIVAGALYSDETKRDLGFNGTYLVFRQLEQDVHHFRKTMKEQADLHGLSAEYVAAKVVGRWPSGTPLTGRNEMSDPLPGSTTTFNNFGFRSDGDADGLRCPIGAHIRRANPRDSLGDDEKVALASAKRHRLLRRGRSYGETPVVELENTKPEKAELENTKSEYGLHFLCLSANLERQFEFVQQTWINNTTFGGLCGEVDPLIGPPQVGCNAMTIPAEPVRQRILGLNNFVTVRGGAYFFLPSLPAIRFLAALRTIF